MYEQQARTDSHEFLSTVFLHYYLYHHMIKVIKDRFGRKWTIPTKADDLLSQSGRSCGCKQTILLK